MKLSTDHPSSSYGIPVFLDDKNRPIDYAEGIKILRKNKKLSVRQLAETCSCSPRTVEGWEYGRAPSKTALKIIQMVYFQ